MIGRTNALVRALVSSVNGMTGVVVLDANIAYDPEETYQSNTIGAELQAMAADSITTEQIDDMYGEYIPPDAVLGSESPSLMSLNMPRTLNLSSIDEPEITGDEEETNEETTEESTDETTEEPVEEIPEEVIEETNEQEDSSE